MRRQRTLRTHSHSEIVLTETPRPRSIALIGVARLSTSSPTFSFPPADLRVALGIATRGHAVMPHYHGDPGVLGYRGLMPFVFFAFLMQ